MTTAEFSLSDAVDLFMKTNESIHGLWNFYMAASFAAVGFAVTSKRFSYKTASIITIAYCLFLIGHSLMLKNAIILKRIVSESIGSYPVSTSTFSEILTRLGDAHNQDELVSSFVIHVLIDLTVIVVIWSRTPYFGRLLGSIDSAG